MEYSAGRRWLQYSLVAPVLLLRPSSRERVGCGALPSLCLGRWLFITREANPSRGPSSRERVWGGPFCPCSWDGCGFWKGLPVGIPVVTQKALPGTATSEDLSQCVPCGDWCGVAAFVQVHAWHTLQSDIVPLMRFLIDGQKETRPIPHRVRRFQLQELVAAGPKSGPLHALLRLLEYEQGRDCQSRQPTPRAAQSVKRCTWSPSYTPTSSPASGAVEFRSAPAPSAATTAAAADSPRPIWPPHQLQSASLIAGGTPLPNEPGSGSGECSHQRTTVLAASGRAPAANSSSNRRSSSHPKENKRIPISKNGTSTIRLTREGSCSDA